MAGRYIENGERPKQEAEAKINIVVALARLIIA